MRDRKKPRRRDEGNKKRQPYQRIEARDKDLPRVKEAPERKVGTPDNRQGKRGQIFFIFSGCSRTR